MNSYSVDVVGYTIDTLLMSYIGYTILLLLQTLCCIANVRVAIVWIVLRLVMPVVETFVIDAISQFLFFSIFKN